MCGSSIQRDTFDLGNGSSLVVFNESPDVVALALVLDPEDVIGNVDAPSHDKDSIARLIDILNIISDRLADPA